ncbi:MAG: DNA polymerase III subunit delta [Candidatus Magasanikbacteria bacterium]|nr:DNA polymerase III subunit delta [Candidatus Magasanikbacteria bacterium]
MIIYIYGEDTFSSHNYLKLQIERFKKERDPQGMNVVILNGQKEESSRLWNEITAMPFLAEKRLVVIQNILSTKDADTLESFIQGVKENKIPEKNVVIFYQSEPMGKSKVVQELHKILAKATWAKEFALLSGAALTSWIKNEVVARGGTISAAALNYLAEHAGSDMWHASSLIDQLVAYAGTKEIALSDVQLFLEEKSDDNIFNMVDAIVAGNQKLAFKLIEDQRRLGQDDGYLFSMILRQFRILISLRDLFNREENISSDQMAKMLGLHPFVVKKSLPLIKRYSLDKLKDIYNQLLEIDIKTKTGLADQSWLIDLFVARLS